jgi:hypothetical protein
MLYAFTDESNSSKFYFQGALIVDENELIALENVEEEILLFATKLFTYKKILSRGLLA